MICPGEPASRTVSASQIFSRYGLGSADTCVYAPGHGTRPRTRFQIARAGCVAGVLALFRGGYGWIRKTEGLGLGDVKLAAAIGAWLPFEAIPLCFGLATSGALVTVILARLSGQAVMRTTRIPLGAFLCPALWIVFFADSLAR